ncbi:MAG: hypothetical protein JKY71_06740 [Alphaproteobacteria bacterium]|nr:hypothetical protein [Alphaproteobacteria bacterium]
MRYVLPLALMALFVLSSPASAEDPATAVHKPQLYDYNGAPVDPLCFLSNVGTEEAPVYPTRFCQYEEIVNVGQSGLDESKFVAVSFEEAFYDPETDESISSFGFIGYRAIGMVEHEGRDLMAVIVVENGGGSGTFTELMLLDPVRDEEEKTLNYRHVETLVTGDRCMGGVYDATIDPENKDLIYRVKTTMADMFLLTGDTEREILKSDAYESLPFCAICCYAEAEFSLEEFRGVFFPQNRHTPTDGSEAAQCVEGLVDLNVTQAKQSYFGKEDFGFFIRELEHTCLGRMEGE